MHRGGEVNSPLVGTCRICLSECTNAAMSSTLGKHVSSKISVSLLEAYELCTQLRACPEDILCDNCARKLKLCYKFIQKARESYAKLNSWLQLRTTDDDDDNTGLCGEAEAEGDGAYVKVEPLDVNVDDEMLIEFVSEEETQTTLDNVNGVELDIADNHVQVNQTANASCVKSESESTTNLTNDITEDVSFDALRKNVIGWNEDSNSKTIEEPESDNTEHTDEVSLVSSKYDGSMRKFSCVKCGMEFDTASERNYHRTTRCGQKDFECTICHKFLSTKHQLGLHMRVHTGERPYECDLCEKKFKHCSHLKAHMTWHVKERFKCHMCEKNYASRDSLRLHINRDHEGSIRHQCKICRKAFSSTRTLRHHVENSICQNRTSKDDIKFSCNFCPRDYKKKKMLLWHINKQHPDRKTEYLAHTSEDAQDGNLSEANSQVEIGEGGIRKYFCGKCPETFPTMELMKEHTSTHKGDHPFECKSCGVKFAIWSALKNHEITHTNERPFGCNFCNKSYKSRKGLSEHTASHKLKTFLCPACDQKFMSRSALKQHLKSHEGEKLFWCQLCEWCFIRMEDLREHIQQNHEGTHNELLESGEFKVGECYIDSMEFLDSSEEDEMRSEEVNISSIDENIQRKQMFNCANIKNNSCDIENQQTSHEEHFSQIHTISQDSEMLNTPKKFTCELCGKDMNTRRQFDYHKASQCGQKSFLCSACPKSFTTKSRLVSHTRTHTGERPYACKCCDKKFTCWNHLNQHMMIHTGERPYSCKECGKSFTQHSTMMLHTKARHLPRTISCPACDKKYARISDLNIHMRSHTGEKPFACTFCSSSFVQRGALNTHIRHRHPDKLGRKGEQKECNV